MSRSLPWLLDKSRPIHLVGVGGSGMSGLARLLLSAGYRVTGSDVGEGPLVEALRAEGLGFYHGHSATNVGDAGLLCYSSAIGEDNPERQRARELGVPEVRRATLLGALLRGRRSLVVSGTHGKTTTTAMLATVLREADLDPGFYVGGEVACLGGNAAWGTGDLFVVEADESDGSLVDFEPHCSIVLNVEAEHLDYFRDLGQIVDAFGALCDRAHDGVFYCRDDSNASGVCAWRGNATSYGLKEGAQVRAEAVKLGARGSEFDVRIGGRLAGRVELRVPGEQNVQNATAVVAVAMHLGVPFAPIAAGLARFSGARRRFEVRYEDQEFMVVDDYGHHPTEIRATLAAARTAGRRRVFAVFQPHRYTRTFHLREAFVGAFDGADRLLMTDVYSAGERPIEGADGRSLFELVRATKGDAVSYEPALWRVGRRVWGEMCAGDLLLFLGAGNISDVAVKVAVRLRLHASLRERLSSGSRVVRNEPLAKHTTMRVGGPADIWIEPEGEEDLATALRLCGDAGVPVTMIGRGSNLLVRDGGIDGACVRLASSMFSSIEVLGGGRLRAGAGVKLRAIAQEAKRAGIRGMEFMEGIPASLGGALRMNAGAMGGWTFECVESVRVMDRAGGIVELAGSDLEVRYREVPMLRENIALSAVLRGRPGDPAKIAAAMASYSQKRWKSQPAMPSAGCIFKNPSACPAGKLIDELGLKGMTFGGAEVSHVHGNFIVNRGGARASDILELIGLVRARVREARGVELETEVIVIGEDA
ncbi:MAG TPA: UDP-N-acetylmuramate--L-alanine ligase [Verrucomicrobiae bacterium]|nr:UDP-N-acetylmuramate--L-alanine ligase [Verrucomicrobiae bacterium]